MMQRHDAALAVGLLALACSGRYEVGGMDDPARPGSGGSAGSGGSEVEPMPPVGMGGTTAVAGGANELGTSCVPAGDVEQLAGSFAPPDVVWQRLWPVIWGREAPPPSALPAQTTHAWVSNVVERALDQAWAASQAASSPDAVVGPRSFLRRWLHLPDDASLDPTWNVLLGSQEPALQTLLLMPLGEAQRFGIFTERAWLVARPEISERGAIMVEALFNIAVPPEPPGADEQPEPNDGLTRRERLASQVGLAVCAACHSIFDPLGVSLEHFDRYGSYRMQDAGKPVDASGLYRLPASGREVSYEDNFSLGHALVGSCEATLGFAGEFLRIALEKAGRSPDARQMLFDESHARVEQAFVRGGRSYRSLVDAYAHSPAVLRP